MRVLTVFDRILCHSSSGPCIQTDSAAAALASVVVVVCELTWCSSEEDGEEVDAHGDCVEDGESSEAVGHRVSLWRCK